MIIREIKEKYAYLYNKNNQLNPVLIFAINSKAKDNVVKEDVVKYGSNALYYLVGLEIKNEKQIPLDELDDYFEIEPIFPTSQRWFVSKWNKISLCAWEVESALLVNNQHLVFTSGSLNIFSEATIELNNQLVTQHYQQEINLWKEEKKQRKLAKKIRKIDLKDSKKNKKEINN